MYSAGAATILYTSSTDRGGLQRSPHARTQKQRRVADKVRRGTCAIDDKVHVTVNSARVLPMEYDDTMRAIALVEGRSKNPKRTSKEEGVRCGTCLVYGRSSDCWGESLTVTVSTEIPKPSGYYTTSTPRAPCTVKQLYSFYAKRSILREVGGGGGGTRV